MTALSVTLGLVGAVLVASVIYSLIQRWLPRRAASDFEPELSITRKNGWALLDLVLTNRSSLPVWVEHATFALADLDVDFQQTLPAGQETLSIGETVKSGETLRISLIDTVYSAAGKPQGEYSFLISGTIRYQAQKDWFEISLQSYRVRMIALSAIRLLRMRWYDQPAVPLVARSRHLRRISEEQPGVDHRQQQQL